MATRRRAKSWRLTRTYTKKLAVLAAVLFMHPLVSYAEAADLKEIAVTDVAQVVGTWVGPVEWISTRSNPAGNDTATVTLKADGTFSGVTTRGSASNGTFVLKEGKARFQMLSAQPPGWSTVGTWTFYESDGKLSIKSTRDDKSVTGDFTKK